MEHSFIYLASQSPRRKQLLEQIHVPYRLLLPQSNENAELLEVENKDELPHAYVQRVTNLKWQAAQQLRVELSLPDALILCSDTTVALNQKILGKPRDEKDAIDFLSQLLGQTHVVLTAVMLGHQNKQKQAISESQVTFANLSDAQIKNYVASQEPMGKAGAYAIQGLAGTFIQHIAGSYSGIMGLPLYETSQLLRDFGFSV
ncbi:MAG: septum formation inhibitor Maf [Betaproteobacteria bacterium]|nr:septum formation inhibitor Maf [Betaproteobacteria bacterium]